MVRKYWQLLVQTRFDTYRYIVNNSRMHLEKADKRSNSIEFLREIDILLLRRKSISNFTHLQGKDRILETLYIETRQLWIAIDACKIIYTLYLTIIRLRNTSKGLGVPYKTGEDNV